MSLPDLHELQEAALACVCSELASTCPCRAYVSPGAPPWDDEGCCDDDCDGTGGTLTVHLDDLYPSDNFPARGDFVHPCKPATWVAQIVVTVLRCVPAMKEDGSAPPVEEMAAAAAILNADRVAVLNALTCCLTEQPPLGRRNRRVQIAGQETFSEQAGCAGFTVTALVDAGQVCCVPGS